MSVCDSASTNINFLPSYLELDKLYKLNKPYKLNELNKPYNPVLSGEA